jgi:hypothetical protein
LAVVNKVTIIRADNTSNNDFYGVTSERGSGGQFSSIVCQETAGIASAFCGSVAGETVKRRFAISDVSPGNIPLYRQHHGAREQQVGPNYSGTYLKYLLDQTKNLFSSNLSSEGLFCTLVQGCTNF